MAAVAAWCEHLSPLAPVGMTASMGFHSSLKLQIWDFILHRDDGAEIRIHPQYITTAAESWKPEGVGSPLRTAEGRPKPRAVGSIEVLKFDGSQRAWQTKV